MDAYKELAKSYDRLTNDVDYRGVVEFYFQILEKEGLFPRTAVDLACGTEGIAGVTETSVYTRVVVSGGAVVSTDTIDLAGLGLS